MFYLSMRLKCTRNIVYSAHFVDYIIIRTAAVCWEISNNNSRRRGDHVKE